MHIREALEQLEAIHTHLARAEVYRGFRASGVAATGLLGLFAAWIQSLVLVATEPRGFVVFWLVVAAAAGVIGGGPALYSYLFREDNLARRRTRQVLAQFLPVIGAGALVTPGVLRAGPEVIPLLPGLWAVLFGLGLVSTRPYLPHGIGRVGLLYIAAGGVLLARLPTELSGWAVGGVFGVGHLATAWVLHAGEPRDAT